MQQPLFILIHQKNDGKQALINVNEISSVTPDSEQKAAIVMGNGVKFICEESYQLVFNIFQAHYSMKGLYILSAKGNI